jgi:hypothetical protein
VEHAFVLDPPVSSIALPDSPASVPEPSAYSLALVGCVGLMLLRARRRRGPGEPD